MQETTFTETLQKAIPGFYDGEWCKSPKDINSGLCADFADFMIKKYKKEFDLYFVDSYDFYEDGIWKDSFGITKGDHEKFVSKDQLHKSDIMQKLIKIAKQNKNLLASHVFIYSRKTGLFYDAERVDGVESPFELPIFQRFIDECESNVSEDI